MMAAGTPPDVFFLNNIDFPGMASRGVLRPLDPFLKRDRYPTGDIFPGILKAFQWKGSSTVFPGTSPTWWSSTTGTSCARRAFPTPGPTGPGGFPALRQGPHLGEGRPPVQWGVSFQTFYLFWQPWVWSAGGRFYSPDHSKFLLNSPASLEGLQFYLDLRYKHHVAPTPEEAQDRGAFTMFLNGQTGMIVDGRWRVPTLRPGPSLTLTWSPSPGARREASWT